MKKTYIIILTVSLLIPLLLSGCRSPLKGSGEVKTEDLGFTDFSHIDIDGPFELTVSCADDYKVTITADDNVFNKIKVANEEETLKISIQKSRFIGIMRTQYVDSTIKAVISMPQLRSLTLSGEATGTCSGFNSRASACFDVSGTSILDLKDIYTGNADLTVSGTSKVTGKITAGDCVFDVHGDSTVQLAGTASNIVCHVSGASRLNLDSFIVDNVDMRLGSASKSTINVDGKLDVNLSGDSELAYIGEPVMGSTKISSGSKMQRK